MTADVPTPDPQLPEFRETPAEWSALDPSGSAGSSGSAQVQEVTLLGDPGAPGMYVQLLTVAPNTTIAAHHHAGDRCGTVITGTWWFGYGDEHDPSALDELPLNSIYTEPSGVNHFAATGSEAVVVQVTGYGPTNTVYADPSQDPRH